MKTTPNKVPRIFGNSQIAIVAVLLLVATEAAAQEDKSGWRRKQGC